MNQSSFEKTLNHVIRNGARIAEGQLGTVLPTKASLKLSDKWAREQAAAKESIALQELDGFERRAVGGEVRYYATASKYAVVSRSLRVLWFEVRGSQTFACK